MASAAIIHFRREELEKRIQELVDLLDLIDGDADLEDGDDAEPEETDQNGDELDCSHIEDEWSPYAGAPLEYDGSGADIALQLVEGLPTFYERVMWKTFIEGHNVNLNRSEIRKRG